MAQKDLTPAPSLSFVPRRELLSPDDAGSRITLPFGIPALIGAFASLTTCYGTIVASSLFGISKLGLNPHVQAAVMWTTALFAVYALWQDRECHHNSLPAALGTVALAALIGTLYVSYSGGIETLAYVLLVIAALLNQTIFLAVLNRTTRDQAQEIQSLNQRLERKVESQIHEIDRLARLKQFLAPQVADLVISEGNEQLLATHRRYIACLLCDIRNFTSISEDLEPEEVIDVLQAYHDRIGGLVAQHGGTIGYRAGDGLMAFFNDPVTCEAPALEAVKLALDIRAAFEDVRAPWSRQGHAIGLGIGIASGYATLGLIGFRGRTDYTAIGGVVNIASRLCDRAADSQILLTRRACLDIERHLDAEPLGAWELKGVKNPVDVYMVRRLREPVA